jgi:hypothetical protein
MSLSNLNFKDRHIKLKEYLKNYSPTFIKIGEDLIRPKDLPEKYLDYYIDRLELIPNGGVIYLNDMLK